MPRQLRLDAPGAVHHVMGRGIECTQIFREDTDRADFVTSQVIAAEGVPERELRSGSRRPAAVHARRVFCQAAVQGMGYAGAEVARFLGVTTSSVNRLAASEELPEVKRYLKAL